MLILLDVCASCGWNAHKCMCISNSFFFCFAITFFFSFLSTICMKFFVFANIENVGAFIWWWISLDEEKWWKKSAEHIEWIQALASEFEAVSRWKNKVQNIKEKNRIGFTFNALFNVWYSHTSNVAANAIGLVKISFFVLSLCFSFLSIYD